MKSSNTYISAFNAKTHLSEVLKKVEYGEKFIVTKRGKPVAKIIPISGISSFSSEFVIQKFQDIRKGIKGKINIKEYIEDGRKY
ncbi:MAG: type II toxin-antitoxin system prevent-host-death family antitoxin [Leptospira sp.]|nr:type II toxin-antitoxin system prevent-host-death family antitoxin [Leptospira sp.]